MRVKGRDANSPPSGSSNGSVRTYSESWAVVEVTASEANAYTVGSFASGVTGFSGGPPVPFIGSVHYADPQAWCRSLAVSCIEPLSYWRVTAEYSSEFAINEDPTEDAPRLSLDGEKFEKLFVKDYQGKWVGNSAGDPFDPPITTEDARRIISVEKNLTDGIPSWFMTYENAVNSDSVTIGGLAFTARQLKMDVLRASTTLTRNDIPFVTLSVSFHARKDTWDSVVPDMGFRVLNDESKPVQALNSGDQEPVTDAIMLDGSGKAIPGDPPDPASAIFRTDRIYPELPFATILTALGL